ncbi:MAG: metallophosphoesterase, partial [Candidatus Zixiibacteriota bacterium]
QAAIQVLGNHDAAAVGMQNLVYFNDFARAAAAWMQTVLTPEQKAFLSALPLEVKEDGLHYVHATPREPQNWNYIFSRYDVQNQFEAVDGRVCFVGHSHVPGDFWERPGDSSSRRIVNVGSVGQPRDRDPRLCYAVFDTATQELRLIREEYDVDTAAGKIRRAGLPEFLADRLYWGW